MSFRGLFAVGLLLALAQPTYAQKPEAVAAFQRGKELEKQGKVAEACAEFEVSMRLDPQSGTLYNLALCHEQLGKVASAWSEFKELAETDKNPARAKDSAKRAAALDKKLTRMRIVVATPIDGLVIKRDGVDVTVMVGKDTPVDPATYTFVASAPGFTDATFEADLTAPGATIDVTVPALTSAVDKPKPDPAKLVTDPYASRLTLRPVVLPKGVYEIGARGTYYQSARYVAPDFQDPIDTGISARAGFGRIEVHGSIQFHTRYAEVTQTRPTITRYAAAGADYVITPLLAAGIGVAKHHPFGGDVAQGFDFRADLTAKRIVTPTIALVGSGGFQYLSRKSGRGGPEASEFQLAGDGAVQIAPLDNFTLGAFTSIYLNVNGTVYGKPVLLDVGASAVGALTRNLDAYIQTALAVIEQDDGDTRSITAGVTYRLP